MLRFLANVLTKTLAYSLTLQTKGTCSEFILIRIKPHIKNTQKFRPRNPLTPQRLQRWHTHVSVRLCGPRLSFCIVLS